ncbi:hypothetical protein [Couchioplanes azureus]|uniref:hypothetical protein n=1 Tax=Couchioplanes caeruleus TaxID=56438 RepID=UPI0016705B3E|nr:hypothetical protein [Couchioplanes caeruleus]GGQ54656.1 hypothetical protein GCM10010166_24530 [Couchioplanes caeruleus subsp. azureus]
MIRPYRLLALAMVAIPALALLGSPAGAAPTGTVEADIFVRHLTLAAGGPTVDEDVSVFLSSDREGWANEVTLSIDTSAAAELADVAVEEADAEVACATTGPVVRCTVPGPHRVVVLPSSGSFGMLTTASVLLSLTPKPGAKPGDTGALTVTATADQGPASTFTARVRVGEAVNLTAVDARSRAVAPGGSVALRPRVRNTGPRDVRGPVLVESGQGALTGTDFGNCTYYGDSAACTFDTTLAAGRTYETSTPLPVRVPPDAAVGSQTQVNAQWLTLAEWQDWQATWHGWTGGRPGTGPNLKLAEWESAAAAQDPQADIDRDDNGTSTTVTVTGGRRADVAAVGATLTGPPGTARTIEVGLVNRGPGTLHYPPFDNNLPGISVTLPPDVSILRADKRCWTLREDDLPQPPPSTAAGASVASGPPEYHCSPESVQLRPGQRLSFTFAVAVAPGARDGKGSVDVIMFDSENSVDRDPGNNTAPITLRLGGGGGGLPVTGGTTATLAAGGALLVLIGTTVTTALRRRSRLLPRTPR